jgi:hypothetical protein
VGVVLFSKGIVLRLRMWLGLVIFYVMHACVT